MCKRKYVPCEILNNFFIVKCDPGSSDALPPNNHVIVFLLDNILLANFCILNHGDSSCYVSLSNLVLFIHCDSQHFRPGGPNVCRQGALLEVNSKHQRDFACVSTIKSSVSSVS